MWLPPQGPKPTNRKEVNRNGKHPKARKQLPIGGVHGLRPRGPPPKPQQKTVHPPEGLTPKAKEKWLEEEAALFERECKNEPSPVDKSITLAEYTAYWWPHIAPGKLAKSTLARDKQDIDRFLPTLGSYKLTELKPEHFRNLYTELRKTKELWDWETALRKHR